MIGFAARPGRGEQPVLAPDSRSSLRAKRVYTRYHRSIASSITTEAPSTANNSAVALPVTELTPVSIATQLPIYLRPWSDLFENAVACR